ncbi:hypothetical protein ES703_66404 [subsurface metagenome]
MFCFSPFHAPIFICLLSLKNELTPCESFHNHSFSVLTQCPPNVSMSIFLNKVHNSFSFTLVIPIASMPQQLDFPSGY